MRKLIVPAGTAPLRLDSFLSRSIPNCSRRIAQRAIAAGEVRVNRQSARKGDSVTAGDRIEVAEGLFEPPWLQPNPTLDVRVLYEDGAVIAVDKPAGMPSHALRRDETGTVANFLLARYPQLAEVGKSPLEPGIVHRLDTETSGVLLAAKTAAAHRDLRRQFSGGEVFKEYVALVEGDVRVAGELCRPIEHEPGDRRKMRVCPPGRLRRKARPAVTFYRPVERFVDYTLLAVQIRTGVTHQIRVHLASIGHPVAGDRLYGATAGTVLPRHLLHASRLGFVHPSTRQPVEVSSPLPDDVAAFLAALRQKKRASQDVPRKARLRTR